MMPSFKPLVHSEGSLLLGTRSVKEVVTEWERYGECWKKETASNMMPESPIKVY